MIVRILHFTMILSTSVILQEKGIDDNRKEFQKF